MNSIRATARFAGLLYVVFSILSVIGYMYIPSTYLVPGDAAATARRITEGALIYRLGILNALVGQILFIFLVLTLYQLFKDVDRKQATLMAVLVCVGAAVEIANLVNRTAPLVLLSGADFLSVFTKPQLDALALGFIRMGSSLGQLITAFWGLWLFPFGYLTIKSGFFPRILGFLLYVSGFAYIVTCVASLVFPEQRHVVTQIMTPLYFGELAIVLWLPIMGAKAPQAETPEAVR
jgi:uncharacterized protein DUF4386